MTGPGRAAGEPAPAPLPVAAPVSVSPMAPVAPQPVIPPRVAAEPMPPRVCLIVDDSRVVRRISRGIVEGLGYVVIEAENGEEALLRCRAAMPHLILLDWDMPVMTGIEFIAAVRALPGGDAPKAMFCTSHAETLDIAKGIAAGADEYVVKPFDEPTLRVKLERIGAI